MKKKALTLLAFLGILLGTLVVPAASSQAVSIEDPDRIVVSYSSQTGAFVIARFATPSGYFYGKSIPEGSSSHVYAPDWFYGFTVPNGWVCISKPYGHHYGPGFYPATWIRGLFIVECFKQSAYA